MAKLNLPLISICIPTFNSSSFLEERLDSIFKQTYRFWELVVADSYSDDGTWEQLVQLAFNDPRVILHQIPKEGIYPAINFCVEQASGQYIYIATSDDSMAPDCLEKLVAALEQNISCDMAHCPLHLKDSADAMGADWWHKKSMFAVSSQRMIDCNHIRQAPFDGLLHLGGETIYISLTQLLIRRSLFNKIGLFESKWGPRGDFNWGMRAGLVADVVHVPDTWATWRLHSAQATANNKYHTSEALALINDMIAHAVNKSESILQPICNSYLKTKWLPYTEQRRTFLGKLQNHKNRVSRGLFLVSNAIGLSPAAIEYFHDRLLGHPVWPRCLPSVALKWWQNIATTAPLTLIK